ncbi:MAG: YraN family protein [Phycisphaerales bacterium]|jgi:putative endonuclease
MVRILSRLLQRLNRVLGLAGRAGEGPPREESVLGAKGEAFAAKYLQRAGYTILERNARLPMGEADLIVRTPQGTHVVVEVKTRARGKNARSDQAAPELAITRHKRRTLRAIATFLGRANNWGRVSVDVIAVEWPLAGGAPTLRHHQGVL